MMFMSHKMIFKNNDSLYKEMAVKVGLGLNGLNEQYL